MREPTVHENVDVVGSLAVNQRDGLLCLGSLCGGLASRGGLDSLEKQQKGEKGG